jgi:hypothetical protein
MTGKMPDSCKRLNNMTSVTQMQDKVFSLNLMPKQVGCPKFAYEVSNWTSPNQIALNWTMQSQTKASIAKLSCADKRENRA